MTESERDQLLFGWNQTSAEYPNERCVHSLFEAQVERSPDVVAVEFGDQRITYRELNYRANDLAVELKARGVAPNTLVGIDTGRSVEFVVAVLGILKAGGAYLPLDPEYPADRLRMMVADSRAPVLVRAVEGPNSTTFSNCEVVQLERGAAVASKAPIGNPPRVNTPDHLAYVIYTSGSTGRPKGVCMPHRPLLNLIHWQNSTSKVAVGERTLQFAPLGFDVCFQEIFATLSTGGTLVLISQQARRDFAGLIQRIQRRSIRRIFLPFVALEYLAEEAESSGVTPTALREIITAGEQLRITPAIRSLFGRLSGSRLVNQYGPAEAHVVTSFELAGNPADWPFWPAIGRPVANTQIYILDADLKPVSAGVSGELYIGGVQVADGYLGRPDLTTARFMADPFLPGPGRRLYRTGDAARWLPDGNIEYQGRVDDQVKIRGFRVELGEVEAFLSTHPSVRECVVVARDAQGQGKSLVAYVVARDQTHPSTHELREFMKQRVPDYMVPAAFVALPAFPLSPNGKVDRKALPEPVTQPEVSTDYLAPRTPEERALAEIWQEALNRPQIGIQDDFFELGGHSLLAARIIGRINRQFNANLEVTHVFGNPTIETLAAALAMGERTTNEPLVVSLQSGEAAPPVFFVWRNAHWDRLRFKATEVKQQPFYITEVPYTSEMLLSSAQYDYEKLPTVEDLAAPHTQLIRETLTTDSCVVAGFSYGVALAFEVAHQLERLGTSVQAVLLFDGEMKPVGWERLKQRSKWHWSQLTEQGWTYPFRRACVRLRGRAHSTGSESAEAEPLLPSLEKLDTASWEERWPFIDRIWVEALKRYDPRPLPGRGVLFRAQGDLSYYSREQDYDGCLGWKRFFNRGVDVVKVPGDHFTMWEEPQVHALRQALAASLGTLLDKPHIDDRPSRPLRAVAAQIQHRLFSTILCGSQIPFADIVN